MKTVITIVCLFIGINLKAGWTNLNTGISDDLTGVVFWGNNGLVCGQYGLYYTTSGGVGPSSWTHFSINGNIADSIVYSNTSFFHAFATTAESSHTDYAFACGKDTSTNSAVIFQFHIPTQDYIILYQGASNTCLKNINYSTASDQYYAVGDNGLIVRFNLNVLGFTESYEAGVDYESVFFSSSNVNVGSHDYHIYGVDNTPGLNLSSTYDTNYYLKDIHRYSVYGAYAVGDGFYFIDYPSGVVTPINNYDFGSLNANSIYKIGTNYFIGTDHGIFRFTTATNALEWQPSSMQHFIYEFWKQPSVAAIYACGKNGVLLSSTDAGGASLPYMTVTEGGVCKGQSITITGTHGSATSCSWYLNGSYVSGSCANFSTIAINSGLYHVKFKGWNSAGTDSAVTDFYVVDTPQIDLPVILNDQMLCKEESVEIQIDQSQPQVYYRLLKIPGNIPFGNSPEGNTGIINYNTNLISEAGNYILQANSTLANCSVKFTDTIELSVEHTNANYHVSEQNLVPFEETQLFENCTDATNFSWEFPLGSGSPTSNLPNPSNTFSVSGSQLVKLICWSDNACYDSIIGPGPTVYNPPPIYDSCWINLNNGYDPPWQGQYFPEISNLCPVSDGYLIAGTFHDHTFATQFGDSLKLDWFGSFLSKYDSNGVYKWNIHSIGAGNVYVTGPVGGGWVNKYSIKSAAEDADGNIYVCGYFKNWYIDNVGDTVLTPGSYGHILKLSSAGKTIWQMTTDELLPETVAVDNAGNIVVTSSRGTGYYGGFSLNLDGIPTDTISAPVLGNFGLTKFTPDGLLVWDIPIDQQNVNYADLLKVGFDDQDHIYLTGTYEMKTIIYAVGNTDTVTNQSLSPYGQKLMLAKFTPGGNLEWFTRSYTLDGGAGDDTQPYDMSVDVDGNCYISGSNDCRTGGDHHYFENTDNSETSHTAGQYFVMKVNSDGICQWMRGGYNSYYGSGFQNELKNDTLYVLGMVSQNGTPSTNVVFDNPVIGYINLDISASDYFIAVYDTSGYLYRIIKNGDNSHVFSVSNFTGFYISGDQSFYVARNVRASSDNTYSYSEFGDTLTWINEYEGWVTKFCESCGIKYKPGFSNTTDTTVCLGSSITFPDGSSVSNITSSFYDSIVYPLSYYMDSIVITHVLVNGYPDLTESVWVCYNSDYVLPDGTALNNITSTIVHNSSLTTVYGCDSLIETTVIPNPEIITTVTVSGYTLISNQLIYPGITYQWIDCNNANLPIAYAYNQSFLPGLDGSYAVVVYRNGCQDTSACYTVSGLSVVENNSSIRVFPNPTNDDIHVFLDDIDQYIAIRLLDVVGQEVARFVIDDRNMTLPIKGAAGIYYLEFITEEGTISSWKITKI